MRRRVTSIRLSEGEIAEVKEKAKVCGKRYTTWCREVVLGDHPRSSVELDFVRQLRLLGHNVNQLTRLAHLGQLGVGSAEELRQIRAALEQMAEVLM